MIRFRRKKETAPHVDITPVIDIVFMLLLFFFIGSTFVKPVLDIKLPSAETKDQAPLKSIIISVDKNEHVFINKVKTSKKELESILKAIAKNNKEVSIIFRADKEAPYHHFLNVMDVLKKLEISKVSLEHL